MIHDELIEEGISVPISPVAILTCIQAELEPSCNTMALYEGALHGC